MRQYVKQQTKALLRNFSLVLNRAARSGDADTIHDLRVAIRRLSRALRVFALFYAEGSGKRIRARLRQAMQLAGAVRDRDIALDCLAKAGIDGQSDIVERLQAERDEANEKFLAKIRSWKEQGIVREWSARLTVDRDGALDPAQDLPKRTARYFSEVRALLAKKPALKDLHQARLATKRFRYTLELFRSCYGAGLESRIAGLRKVQQTLGDVNDSVVSRELLSRTMKKSSARKQVRNFLKQAASEHAAAFHKEWTEHFDAPGQEDGWKLYLKNIRKST